MKTWTLAIATTVATFVLLLVGGTVNPTGSSLACPDWPTCFGSFVPEMTGGVLFEHSHRLVATAVGAMTVVLAISIWVSRKQDRGVRVLGLVAAFGVVFQGILGGITVLYRLPTLVSTAHLGVALAFFSLLIYLCFRLRPEPSEIRVEEGVRRGARWALGLSAAAVYLQILLGALVRHTGSGHACPVLPLCGGEGAQLWPALGAERLHMVHRGGGFVVFFVVLLAAVYVLRRVREGRIVRRMTLLAPALLLLQILVGAWTVLTHIAWVPAMLHLGVAAAILASLLVAFLGLVPAPADQTTGRRAHASGTSPLPTLQEGETT